MSNVDQTKAQSVVPSNCVPEAVLMVVGEKDLQMIVSQIFVAMNREIPDPRPYPKNEKLEHKQ